MMATKGPGVLTVMVHTGGSARKGQNDAGSRAPTDYLVLRKSRPRTCSRPFLRI